MAVAPVESSQATTTENSTLPAVEASEEEEVDTFLQAVNGQLPGFGGSKESEEEVTTELEEEVTEASNTDDKHGDVLHTEDITSNVWADPDVEVFTTENVNTQTDSDMTTQD